MASLGMQAVLWGTLGLVFGVLADRLLHAAPAAKVAEAGLTIAADAAGQGLVTLVLGGARSGKSRYAEWLIASYPQPWIYVATAQARDDEMAERIAAHQARREAGWQTVEAPHALAEALEAAPAGAAVLVDCLTLWLSNLMEGGARRRRADRAAATGACGAGQGRPCSSPTRSASASCPTTRWRAASATCKATSTKAGSAGGARDHDGRRPAGRSEKPMTKPIDDKHAERHRAKMANRKARQDAEVAGKTIEKGLLIVHTGTGKGKSTAAFGLALRMLGRGKRDRRRAVHQGRLAHGRARRAGQVRRSGLLAHHGRGLHLGDAGPQPATSPRPSAPGPRRKS